MKIDDYELFQKNQETLKELSKDDNTKDINEYMVELENLAVDFDEVKRIYANSYKTTEEMLNSVDAIMNLKNHIFFIEFKNGKISSNTLQNNIKKKIYSSLLIFCDITNKNLNYIRENASFILVYNKDKNENSNSKKKIANYVYQKANENFTLFGLEKYKNLFFKNVYTYSENEFEDFIKKNT